MDAVLDKARDVWEGEIDFEGQRLAELLSTTLLTAIGVISFLVGYVTQNITYTLWTGLVGTALAFVFIVPSWPFFNKHPVSWLPARKQKGYTGSGSRVPIDASKYNITVNGKKVS